ncbi:MAG: class I SAM-dependent rRNA methyltransferase [Acidimicrobiales bacterium]
MEFTPPTIADKRLAVRVSRGAERAIRSGHPWVFGDSIETVSHAGGPGDLAVVFDHNRKFVAIGLWDPDSPIRVRVLHAGAPKAIDEEFWHERVLEAVAIRDPLLSASETTALRLINGENDGFPGLVVDSYADVAVAKIYSVAWVPHIQLIAAILQDLLGLKSVVARCARNLSPRDLHGLRDGAALHGGEPVGPVEFWENGLVFRADLVQGQKTGHFIDQRDNRAMVQALAADARTLDVFAGTGGFSVHAAAGGARTVTSVDASRHSLDSARINMELNQARQLCGPVEHQLFRGDAFEMLAALAERNEQFDLVVLDPPSFAQRQSSVPAGLTAYKRLTQLGLAVLEDGGTFVQASCSSRIATDVFVDVVQGAAAGTGVILGDVIVTGHALDHPVTFPEGSYLKALYGTKRVV